jgi:hypothetical protein
MTRIFYDMLDPSYCSGTYTLMGFVNARWLDIYTLYGATDDSIEIDGVLNTIDVDTTIFIPGQSYLFKWVDSNGVDSNIRVIYIPAVLLTEPGSDILTEDQGLILLER